MTRKNFGTAAKSSGWLFPGIVCLFLCSACATPHLSSNKEAFSKKTERETYCLVQSKLEKAGAWMDYDTLMDIYPLMVDPDSPIPHTENLLGSMIRKRNKNPRVDQMILIFSSKIIGRTPFPIPDVYGLFESMIQMGDDRVNEWVISFIAAAIGSYPFEIPEGDRLVDLLQKKLVKVATIPRDSREYFGYHFLPPPKSRLIRSHIADIKEKSIRELERKSYYALTIKNITEYEIETALKRLKDKGTPENQGKCATPLNHILSEFSGKEDTLLKSIED